MLIFNHLQIYVSCSISHHENQIVCNQIMILKSPNVLCDELVQATPMREVQATPMREVEVALSGYTYEGGAGYTSEGGGGCPLSRSSN